MSANTVRIQRLEAELALYKEAFDSLVQTKADLGQVVAITPTRERLMIEVARLRECLHWALVIGDFHLRGHQEHIQDVIDGVTT